MGAYKRLDYDDLSNKKPKGTRPEDRPVGRCSINGCLIYDKNNVVELQGNEIACADCAHHSSQDVPHH